MAGKVLIGFVMTASLVSSSVLGVVKPEMSKADSILENPLLSLAFMQANTLMAVSTPAWPFQPVKKMNVLVTAYSSTVWQTDNDPFTTASGSNVRNGIVANNLLPFGTKIKIPELYGEKIFVVEDRMKWTKSKYHFDIWFPEYSQAKNFGAKTTYIEVYEN